MTNQPASTAPLAAGLPLVQGKCPACAGTSLFLGNGGYVTCSRLDCPEPDAASTLLEQPAAVSAAVAPPTQTAVLPPAATCSAQYHGPGEDQARLCIRAAQHQRTAHTDEHGFHWSDTVATYPVADGTFRTGTNVRAELRRMADETATEESDGARLATLETDLADGPVRCPLCPTPLTLHTPSGARAHFTTVHPEQRITGREPGPWPLLVADETATETPEDPARIDRLRPEFTEHASVEAIDAQLDRARRQERRWHIRAEWLIGLRQARADEPAAGARQDGAET